MQLYQDEEEKTPSQTPEKTPETSGEEDGGLGTDKPSPEVEEEAATPNGPIPNEPPKSILKKKDLEVEDIQETESEKEKVDDAEDETGGNKQ